MQNLVENFNNLLKKVLNTFNSRDSLNYDYLKKYLKNVLWAYDYYDRQHQRRGVIVENQYYQFIDNNNKFRTWVIENFNVMMKNEYDYIYNEIMNTLNNKIFQKINLEDY